MSTPVTVLCGALGAGKTTLLTRLLESVDRDVAVLVNDVGEVNVDAELVEARTDLGDSSGELVALENGCICCSLGAELSRTVVRLRREHEFDALVIEASGVGEPEPIANAFTRGPAGGVYDLDTVVTVVDAPRFHDAVLAGDGAAGEGRPERGADESGARPLEALWLEQVEFCDHLVVNKCDLVSEAVGERVVAALESLQPGATLERTAFGAVDPDRLLETGRFDPETVRRGAGWKRAVEDGSADWADRADRDRADERSDREDHDHDHREGDDHADHGHGDDHDHRDSVDRYGLEVTTYRRGRPFHPERLFDVLASPPDGLVRAKGLCWIAGRERQAITASVAGGRTTLEVTGRWIASLPEDRREAYRRGQPDLPWDERWGDRESRLALIGRDLDLETVADALEDCLLTDAEMEAEWSTFPNRAPTVLGETTTVAPADDPTA